MRILILGGNRFIGADLVSRMVMDGHDVTVAALDPPVGQVRTYVRFIELDRRDPGIMLTALKNLEFDVVLDNIAFIPTDVELFLEVMNGRIGRYVMTSSADIYPFSTSRCYSERHEVLFPSDLENAPAKERYLRGKRGCEKTLRKSSIPWSIIRPAMVFGLTDPVAPPPATIHGMGKKYGRSLFFPCRIMDRGPILLRQDERRAFSIVSSQDVASALAIVATHPQAVGESFNVAGDEVWTLERMIRSMGATIGYDTIVLRPTEDELRDACLSDYDYPYRNSTRWSLVDNTKLKSFGWTPTPPAVSFARLLESVPPERERPFYDRRLKEIALGHKVMRKMRDMATLHKPKSRERNNRPKSEKKNLLEGRFSRTSADLLVGRLPLSIARSMRDFQGIPISVIGVGTHRGDADRATNDTYHQAIIHAVQGGINVIDTAINYRYMMAERTVGRAIRDLLITGIPRSALCVCSKGGFVPSDAEDLRPRYDYIWDEYVMQGFIDMREAVIRHTIKPLFIRKLLSQSLGNLGIDHIDVYYLHNPELARVWMGERVFYEHLRATFVVLEQAVKDGQIGCYGIATWTGLRVLPNNDSYLSLEKVNTIALEVGGEKHHFKAIQLPLNVRSSEALFKPTQSVKGQLVPPLEAATLLGLHVFTSAAVDRGHDLPPEVHQQLDDRAGVLDEIQLMLNFSRSVDGVTTALVGMRRKEYAVKALQVAAYPKMARNQIQQLAPASKLSPVDVEPSVGLEQKPSLPSLATPSLSTSLLRTLIAGGDVMLGRDLPGYVARYGRQSVVGDLPHLLSAADIALVNLECVLSNRGEFNHKGERRPFHYRCPPDMVNLLVDLGVSAVTTANNHSFDYGLKAITDQDRALATVGIAGAGSGKNLSEASKPVYLAAGETTVAVISFETETLAHAARADKPGVFHVPIGDNAEGMLAPVIEEARSHADLVIISPHWGLNWKETPSEPIRRLARCLIDQGADAVLGHGAHILQGIEIYRGCPVVFDMGGLIFDRNAQSRMRQSAIFEFGFDREGVKAIAVHPVSLVQNAATFASGVAASNIRELIKNLTAGLGCNLDWQLVGDALVVKLTPERKPIKTVQPRTVFRRDVIKSFDADSKAFPSDIIHQNPPVALKGSESLDLGSGLEVMGYRHPEKVQPGFSFLLEVLFRCPQTGGENWMATVRAEPIEEDGDAFSFKHPVADGLWVSPTWSGREWISDLILVRPPVKAKAGRYQLSWTLIHSDSGNIWPAQESGNARGWVKLGEITLTDTAPKGVAGVSWGDDVKWRPLTPTDMLQEMNK